MITTTRICSCVFWIAVVIGPSWSGDTPQAPDTHQELNLLVQKALRAQKYRNLDKTEKDDQLMSENKNRGIINTIVNHNQKIHNIENKMNVIVNNFANSSHVKEIVEKTKELEKHIFGTPRPHSSWRDLLLVAILVLGVIGILIFLGNKIIGPGLIKYVQKRAADNTEKVATVSEYVPYSGHNNTLSTGKLKVILEQQLDEQNKKLIDIMNKLDEFRVGENELVRR
jgi:hypothetical protein